jgi:predicted exporter
VKLPILPAPFAISVFVVLLGVGAFGATRITIETDVTKLLPKRGDGSLVELARRFGMMRKVAVVVGPAAKGDEDHLFAAADAVADAARKLDGVAAVTSRVDMAEAKNAAAVVLGRAARLARVDRLPQGEAQIGERVAQLKERLGAPEAIVLQEYLLKDPLGLGRDALKGLEAVGRGQGARVEGGHLVSLDGRYALVFLDLSFDAMDVERAAPFVEALDRAIGGALKAAGAADVPAVALGGVHFAAASASSLIADLKWSSVAITVLVAGVFLLFFRRLRLLLLALVPGLLGSAIAAGTMGFAGLRVHALTLGFASTITGISIDYAIHLFHRALGETEGDTRARMSAALRAVVGPVTLGCATAVAAFLLVATSEFTSVRQLAAFAAISVGVSLLTALFLLPSLHRLVLGGKGSGLRDTAERWSMWFVRLGGDGGTGPGRRAVVILVFAAIAAIGAFGLSRATLSGDPKDLSYTPPDLVARQAELAKLFPGLADQALLVAEGGSRDEALARNDALFAALLASGVKEDDVVSVSPFLPSLASQKRSLAASSALLAPGQHGARAAMAAAGFSPSFVEGLGVMLDVPPIEPSDYRGTALDRLVTEAIAQQGGRWYVLTRVKGGVAIDAFARVAASVPGCRALSERGEAREALTALHRDLAWMLGIWGVVALVLIAVVERSLLFSLRAVLPPAFGVLAAVGLYGLLGRPLTPVASAALTMVLGLGINYGVYVEHEPVAERGRVAAAVFADALTTIVGFAALAFADNRAMSDIGLMIVVGLTAAMLCAMIALPALKARRMD